MPAGKITYSPEYGHVCTCSRTIDKPECEGHPAGPYDPMGMDVYCNGSCQPPHESYAPTVQVAPEVAPTDSGSYLYVCSQCGVSGWSGL